MKYLFCLMLLAAAALAFPPFMESFQIYSSGDMLESGYNSSPLVHDWNGDGLNDLVIACLEDIGDEKYGTIRFYPNSGTNANPVFDSFSRIMADGKDIFTNANC